MTSPAHRIARTGASLATAGALLAAVALAAPAQAAPPPGETAAPKTVVYVEVNSNDLANVADYTLEGTNRPAFDIASIFAANINYDGTQAYLHLNDRVTWTLENADTQIRPVQARGTKVLLSVLGNHEGAGFANFTTPAAADAFAAQLEDAVDTYGLDGIDFDDEWVEYGKNGTAQPNAESFGWLLESLRSRLGPDKLITLYNIGPSAEETDFASLDTGALLDYAWNPYYGAYWAPSIPGLATAQLGAAAVDLTQTDVATAERFAKQTVADGLGAYVTYNLTSSDVSAYMSTITQAFHGLDTVYKAAPVDDVAPVVAVKEGGRWTATHGKGGSYNKVTFHLTDETGLARAELNGVVTDLGGVTSVDLGVLKPGVGGTVRGTNTLVLFDTSDNATTLTFSMK